MRPRTAVTIKLAVQNATHATTVAVYCQCNMQHWAAVARKVVFSGATTPPL
ncbi:MAG: hypothetical protein J6B32_00005 [Spirochaetaceae bacterium]|nr:hypothetical protein [Spirochaetaceae bacterium]